MEHIYRECGPKHEYGDTTKNPWLGGRGYEHACLRQNTGDALFNIRPLSKELYNKLE